MLGTRFTKTFALFFILFGSTLSQGQLQVSPDWFTYNTGGGSHTYSWQADQKHFEALSYNISTVLFDLHNFDCFDSVNPQKCLSNFQRCPVPRTKSSNGSPDVGSWDTFMGNFDIPDYDVFPTLGSDPLENLGYCTDQKQMIGEYSTTIMTSPVINKNFAPTYLSNRQGFFLDSYAAVPKAIRRSASAIVKQMMNGIKYGLPVTVGPDTPAKAKMNCDGSGGYVNFKNHRNFAEYNFDKESPAGNDTRRQIKGPMGFYDCAQREIGNNDYVTSPYDRVEYTVRDRGNNPDFKCVDKRDEIYFEEEDCVGYAYINLGSSPTPKDFYRYRSNVSDAEQAVVDLTKAPYASGTSDLGKMLQDSGGFDNPDNTSKSMHTFLMEFATSTGATEADKKSIVVAYFTEILDRTIYYVRDDEIFRRTVKFGYTGGSTSLPTNYENYITHEYSFANASSAPKSKMIPTTVSPFYSCVNLTNAQKTALVGDYFGYLDRIAGNIQDYSGYVMRPYREINPSAPAGVQKEALYSRTIEMKSFGPPDNYGDGSPYDGHNWNDFLDFIKLHYPFSRTPMVRELGYPRSSPASGSGPGFDNVNKPSGPYDDCQGMTLDTILNGGHLYLDPSPPGGMLCQVVCPGPVTAGAGSCRNTGATLWQAKCNATCFRNNEEYESKTWTLTRREWWTDDGIADKSGFLNVLTCSPDENMIALGKEDPLTTFTATPAPYPGYRGSPPALNPLSGATHPYCSSLDGSDPAKCVRQGGGGFKEDFNKYCVRYLVGKKVRRDETSGETGYGPFGNVLADMSALSLGVIGGAMVCEDDEIYVKKASGSVTQGPYKYAAKHPDGGTFTNYTGKLDNDAYFFKEAIDYQSNYGTPAMDIDLILETQFNSPGPSTGREMTIPARSLGLGNPDARLPMLYGLCIRPKLELDYPTLRMGPLSLPFRNYIIDYMILNSEGGAAGPPNCP